MEGPSRPSQNWRKKLTATLTSVAAVLSARGRNKAHITAIFLRTCLHRENFAENLLPYAKGSYTRSVGGDD
jgi:hypothetical protein